MTAKLVFSLAAFLSATMATSVPAADTDGLFAIRGIGGQPCSAITAAINDADEADRPGIIAELATWLGGYLTFANRTTDGKFEVTPFVSDVDMLAIVVDRCEKEPELTFETAAFDILAVLSPFGPGDFSEVVVAEGSVALRISTLSALREALVLKGYLEPSLDGSLQEAIRQFNSDLKIDQPELIGIETILRILDR